jgi:GNAT superfamily N-acetyltransferase
MRVPTVESAGRVRRLRRADLDRWRELWEGYISFYRAEVPGHVTDSTFARLCDGDHGMLGLVAVDAADRPTGFAHLVFHSSTWSSAEYCYLEDLFVDPLHRGARTGRALIEAVYAAAREQGAERVYWHTQAFNGAARSLYDTVGRLTSFIVYEHEVT